MESSKRIAIFCNSFPPEGGAASNRIYNLACLLRDAGYKVLVIAAMPNYPTGKIFKGYRRRWMHREVIDGIMVMRVWLIPSHSSSILRRGLSLLSFSGSARLHGFSTIGSFRPDLLIVSSPPLLPAALAVTYFKKRGAKVLLNISDIWPLSAHVLGAVSRGALYTALQKMERRMYEQADFITAQSNETLAHIKGMLGTGKPLFLYRNLPPPSAQAVITNPVHPVRIIYPGLLGHAQGILDICKHIDFASLGTSLHIYGSGAELQELSEWIVLHPARGVYLHKAVPANELSHLMADFSAMLVPLVSPIEGALPSKFFTAINAGLPVLFSAGGEGAALLKQYGLGWVSAPGDYPALADTISQLKSMHEDDLRAMRAQIIAVANATFSKARQDKDFLLVIRELIASTPHKKG
jgi:glycosyltransferase involved in cell wall biosynthesis